MASGEKTNDVFTRTGMGEGKSEGIVDSKIGSGQVLKSAYPMDNVHGYSTPGDKGGSVGGGETYLGHSLKGASAVMDPNRTGKREGHDLRGRKG